MSVWSFALRRGRILSSIGWMAGLLLAVWGMVGIAPPVAAKDWSRQTPLLKTVELGGVEGQLEFRPSQLTFKPGSLYQLTLSNPSPMKHYFTAKDFADAVWTRKVEVAGVEIKGGIHSLELKPGSQAEWWFVPIQSGSYSLVCTIPGHEAAGMVGQLTISD